MGGVAISKVVFNSRNRWSSYMLLVLWIPCRNCVGQVENAEVRKPKYRNGSTETEVRKRKYGSEKKSRLSVFSAFLTHEYVCWGLVDKRGLNLCDVRAGSSALGLRRVSLLQIVQCACDSQTQTKRVLGPTMWDLCSWNVLIVMQMRVLS